MCRELRDVEPDGSGDFGFEPPAGLRVVQERGEGGSTGLSHILRYMWRS